MRGEGLTAAAEQGDWTAWPLLERYVLRVRPLCREIGCTPSRVATPRSSEGGGDIRCGDVKDIARQMHTPETASELPWAGFEPTTSRVLDGCSTN